MTLRRSCLLFLVALLPLSLPGAEPKPYRLPPTDLKQPILWGSVCEVPDGPALAFGGQDQTSADGRGHTRIKADGAWKDINEELRKNNPVQALHDRLRELLSRQRELLARARRLHFQGETAQEQAKRFRSDVGVSPETFATAMKDVRNDLSKRLTGLEDPDKQRLTRAGVGLLGASLPLLRLDLPAEPPETGTGFDVRDKLTLLHNLGRDLEVAAELLDAEPPPRALSPLTYDPKTKYFVLFGGDHFDYLTNDTWVFDPAKKKWMQRYPEKAPPPRANHTLKANGDGTITLTGGYTYTSSTDYCGGQYRDIDDGEWTYDVAANTWKGKADGVKPTERTYRTGKFHPDYYLEGPKPDAAATAAELKDLPANTWVSRKPPHLPRLNRDWGTAVLDVDRDLILRWSGGHSAHGGTDVLHYHIATNRWELTAPVEFPLGQLYNNTEYPDGFNFNMRPWITGHTYQSYGYDPVLKKMLFTGRERHCYIYDPDLGDWAGRFDKPKGMSYNSCFYTLTLCPTPRGLMCWTEQGLIFRFDAEKKEWIEVPLKGEKLPGSVVDNSTVVHDAKRDRLLFFRKGYGDKVKFDGQVFALDLKTSTVSTLSPAGMEAAAAIPYLCQLRWDAKNDLLLVGATLPPGEDGIRRTPAYDCAGNRWISLKLGGTDPSGKTGRNVSLGLMYDSKRNFFWAVDTDSNVFVLRLDPAAADVQALR